MVPMRARRRRKSPAASCQGLAPSTSRRPVGRAQGGAEQAQQAGLAGARGTDDGDALAGRQLQVEPVQGAQAVGVGKPEMSGNDGWGHGRCGTTGWRRLSGEETHLIRPALLAACSMPS